MRALLVLLLLAGCTASPFGVQLCGMKKVGGSEDGQIVMAIVHCEPMEAVAE